MMAKLPIFSRARLTPSAADATTTLVLSLHGGRTRKLPCRRESVLEPLKSFAVLYCLSLASCDPLEEHEKTDLPQAARASAFSPTLLTAVFSHDIAARHSVLGVELGAEWWFLFLNECHAHGAQVF